MRMFRDCWSIFWRFWKVIENEEIVKDRNSEIEKNVDF